MCLCLFCFVPLHEFCLCAPVCLHIILDTVLVFYCLLGLFVCVCWCFVCYVLVFGFVFVFLVLSVCVLFVFVLFVWYACVCFICLGFVGLFLFCFCSTTCVCFACFCFCLRNVVDTLIVICVVFFGLFVCDCSCSVCSVRVFVFLTLFYLFDVIACFLLGGSFCLCGMSVLVSYVWVLLVCVCSVFAPRHVFASCC